MEKVKMANDLFTCILEVHAVSFPASLQAPHANYWKEMVQIQLNMIKDPIFWLVGMMDDLI